MLDDLALFVDIVEAGSLNGAARKLNIPTATVTRRLQALERSLGYRLLTRTARRMVLTMEGNQYYEQCRPLIHALRQATQGLDAVLDKLSGHIRVLAPNGLAGGPLAPVWAGFLAAYPGITLELQLSSTFQDLVGSGADLALRIGELPDSSLMQRRLGSIGYTLVASPAYLRQAGAPRNAEELTQHSLIVATPLDQWTLRDPGGGAVTVLRPTARMRVDDLRLAVAMAESGSGILMCPSIMCKAGLAEGRLRAVMEGWLEVTRPIHAVWSQQRFLSARVKALVDYLAAAIAAEPLLMR
ncbi:LysR family transcriptional regulator [Massilia endophytica]|uniref:LysR family transcriptional regulator n=1 Tax=Massilia endophytica TaxID=2899220 RepID=UPI001E35ED7A|nr:LysR family transcriptional regulator [Massilia endophytica]UGQ47420.1 LysR family transcriptional regulator [Massilia endophytica]